MNADEFTAPPSCARKHPGVPSELRSNGTAFAKSGKVYQKIYCRVCGRLAEAERRARGPVQRAPVAELYGVLPRLTWLPPERLAEGA